MSEKVSDSDASSTYHQLKAGRLITLKNLHLIVEENGIASSLSAAHELSRANIAFKIITGGS